MTSAHRRSEEALATLACAGLAGRPGPSVLIGGLGMAFTLRAALDVLPPAARVVVAELNPEVVAWCRGPLGALTGGAAADPRVKLEVADVARLIAGAPAGEYDAIVLDLYEGPHEATQRAGDPFYGSAALARTHAALAPGGVLAVWSEDPDQAFEQRLAAAGFEVRTHRAGRGGRSHVVYLGVRADKKKGGPEGPPLLVESGLRRANGGGLEPLGALDDLEHDLLTLGEAAEAVRLDGRMVDEHVRTILARDETKTLRIIEPLHSASFHDHYLLYSATCRISAIALWFAARNRDRHPGNVSTE